MLRTITLRSNGITSKGAKTLLEGLTGKLGGRGGGVSAITGVSMKDLLAARMMNAQTAGTLNTLPRKEGPQEIRSSQEDEAKDSNNGTEGDTRDDDVLPNLISIDIADNDIDASGASHLAELLKQAKTLLRLDVSYNPLGDDGCRTLFAAMAPPNPDFLEDPGAEAKDERYNSSLTYADFSCCGLAHYAAEQLLDMFRTIRSLHTSYWTQNQPSKQKDMKHFFNAIRSYGRYLQHLSVCDNNMSSKSVAICRVGGSGGASETLATPQCDAFHSCLVSGKQPSQESPH